MKIYQVLQVHKLQKIISWHSSEDIHKTLRAWCGPRDGRSSRLLTRATVGAVGAAGYRTTVGAAHPMWSSSPMFGSDFFGVQCGKPANVHSKLYRAILIICTWIHTQILSSMFPQYVFCLNIAVDTIHTLIGPGWPYEDRFTWLYLKGWRSMI